MHADAEYGGSWHRDGYKAGMTDSGTEALLFSELGPRKVAADFSGDLLSSDGGVLLLRQIDRGLGPTRHLARSSQDVRDSRFVQRCPIEGAIAFP